MTFIPSEILFDLDQDPCTKTCSFICSGHGQESSGKILELFSATKCAQTAQKSFVALFNSK